MSLKVAEQYASGEPILNLDMASYHDGGVVLKEELRMVDWMSRIGWGSLVIGALLCTPLADLLPLELSVHLKQLLSGTPPGPSHLYTRVISVPETSADPFKLVGAVLMVLGLILVTAGHRMRSRR